MVTDRRSHSETHRTHTNTHKRVPISLQQQLAIVLLISAHTTIQNIKIQSTSRTKFAHS